MPHYFFDTFDGRVLTRDVDGLIFKGPEEAHIEALRALPELARDVQVDGHALVLTMIVRTEENPSVFIGTLTLAAIHTS